MHPPERSIQLNHLLTMRCRIITLLPIPSLLHLPLQHNLSSRWTNNQHIDYAGDEDGGEGIQDGGAGRGVKDAGDAGGDGDGVGRGVGQGHEDWESGLQSEVDWEHLLLQLGELGTVEGTEGDDAADEGL